MTSDSQRLAIGATITLGVLVMWSIFDPFTALAWWFYVKILLGPVVFALGVLWVATWLIHHAWKGR